MTRMKTNNPTAAAATNNPSRAQLESLRQQVEQTLEKILPGNDRPPQRLHQAMRYSVTGGGKRIRPVLTLATAIALDIAPQRLLKPACAVELIHAYSLIHDDLPAMDNDDLRRGRPTCHKAFDEATAILAGDALQALAFEILTMDPDCADNAELKLHMLRTLAQAAGAAGMAGGQAIDLASVNKALNLAELEQMHRLKTGALIEASVLLATFASARVTEQERRNLRQYAQSIGLAFQIQDDILDVIGDTQTLGKTQGADMALNKPTYYSLLGLDGAREKLGAAHHTALASLAGFGSGANLLRQIADYIVERTH
jgi:geranylgeranyl diphosphate synthase type II